MGEIIQLIRIKDRKGRPSITRARISSSVKKEEKALSDEEQMEEDLREFLKGLECETGER